MKKQNIGLSLPHALLGVCFFAAFWISPVSGINFAGSSATMPPPDTLGNLQITDITPTSITLTWTVSSASSYYRVTGINNTTLVSLTPMVVTGNTCTVSNLTPGDYFTLQVSSGASMMGPWSPPASRSAYTIIIVDKIIEFTNACTPSNLFYPEVNTPYPFLVHLSTTHHPYPLTNGFLGRIISVGDQDINFGFGFDSNQGVNKIYGCILGSSIGNFTFISGPNQTYVDCYYHYNLSDAQKIFTVTADNYSIPVSAAHVTFVFHTDVYGFYYCNSMEGGGHLQKLGGSQTLQPQPDRLAANPASLTAPAPNPFSDQSTLRYTLDEDGPVQINLYNTAGRLVQNVENKTLQQAGSYEAVVQGLGLPAGVYILQVQTGAGRHAYPLVKEQ